MMRLISHYCWCGPINASRPQLNILCYSLPQPVLWNRVLCQFVSAQLQNMNPTMKQIRLPNPRAKIDAYQVQV